MTNEKVAEVSQQIIDLLMKKGAMPVRMDASANFVAHDQTMLANHALWMALQLHDMAIAGRSEGKQGRWLGWIQCALWVLGLQSIEQAKRANMSESEAFDVNH